MRGTTESAHRAARWSGGQNYGAGTTGGDAEEGVDPRRVRASRVRTCALSGAPLAAPVVADELGNLFNKLAILEAISARTLPTRLAHIRGLRDLVDCRLTTPVGGKDTTEYHTGEAPAVAACPVSGQLLDGSKPFVVLRTTGWVLSQTAVDEVGLAALRDEYGPFEASDLIRVAPDDAELETLRHAMAARRDAAKQRRKDDKKRRRGPKDDAAADERDAKAGTHKAAIKRGGAAAPEKGATTTVAPVVTKPVVLSDAARVAAEARRTVRGTREKDGALDAILHHDKKGGSAADGDSSKAKTTTSAKDLFIATAPQRYYLN